MVVLPEYLRPHDCQNLIRIGKPHDGGYIMCADDILKSDCLIGLGVCDDWSFEAQFAKRNDINILCYDGSVSLRRFLKNAVKNSLRVDHPSKFFHWINTAIQYRKFFSGKHKHIEKFVGFDLGNRYVSLNTIIDTISAQQIFLKIDIEGAEYRILDEIIARQDRVSGLVMEFHDCDIHLDRISAFIEKFSLPLIHVHANNYGEQHGEDGMPLSLELSFSRYGHLGTGFATLPNPLDTPNNPQKPEIIMTYAAA